MKQLNFFLALGFGLLLAATAGCGSGPAGGGAASGLGAGPAWSRNQALTGLDKLGNFTLRTAEINNPGQRVIYVLTQHSPDNFRLTESNGATYVQAGGHRYYSGDGGKDFLDYGVTTPGSAASGVEMAASAWQGILGNGAGFAGPCAAAGRTGNSFRLSGVAATVCVDATTGALLAGDLKGSGYEETFQITGLSNVPPIQAPAGAQAHHPSSMDY